MAFHLICSHLRSMRWDFNLSKFWGGLKDILIKNPHVCRIAGIFTTDSGVGQVFALLPLKKKKKPAKIFCLDSPQKYVGDGYVVL